ncbi:hypothetical protein BLA29_001444 [Euroglyphus maynei]|uniref:CCHC-type domain-containing protein n=1 Tax=Euroglyphus maynei TaxID=6958 RepID=A0A1Y3B265_EURMA|nr:hypothetical protein BLA29_001444 [Euroglyphus maynei]
MQKFYAISWNDNIKETFTKIRSVSSELSTKGRKLSDGELVSKVLAILPRKYESILNSIEAIRLTTGSNLTFVQLEKLIRGSLTATNAGDEEEKKETTSKNVLGMAKRKNRILRCYNCHQEGHIRKNCPLLKNSKDSKKPKVTLMNLKSIGSAGRLNGLPKPLNDDNYEYCEIFADGGASQHTFNDKKYFTDIRQCDDQEIVSPGGNVAPSAIGSVELEIHDGKQWFILKLTNVLLVEKSPMNMISLGQLSKHNGIHFGGDYNCTIIYKDGEPLMYADRSDKYMNVYEVRARMPKKRAVMMAAVESLAVWHERYNHVNAQLIKSMAKDSLVGGLPTKFNQDIGFCKSCFGYEGESIYRCYHRESRQIELSSTVKWDEQPCSQSVNIISVENSSDVTNSEVADSNPGGDCDNGTSIIEESVDQTGEIDEDTVIPVSRGHESCGYKFICWI